MQQLNAMNQVQQQNVQNHFVPHNNGQQQHVGNHVNVPTHMSFNGQQHGQGLLGSNAQQHDSSANAQISTQSAQAQALHDAWNQLHSGQLNISSSAASDVEALGRTTTQLSEGGLNLHFNNQHGLANVDNNSRHSSAGFELSPNAGGAQHQNANMSNFSTTPEGGPSHNLMGQNQHNINNTSFIINGLSQPNSVLSSGDEQMSQQENNNTSTKGKFVRQESLNNSSMMYGVAQGDMTSNSLAVNTSSLSNTQNTHNNSPDDVHNQQRRGQDNVVENSRFGGSHGGKNPRSTAIQNIKNVEQENSSTSGSSDNSNLNTPRNMSNGVANNFSQGTNVDGTKGLEQISSPPLYYNPSPEQLNAQQQMESLQNANSVADQDHPQQQDVEGATGNINSIATNSEGDSSMKGVVVTDLISGKRTVLLLPPMFSVSSVDCRSAQDAASDDAAQVGQKGSAENNETDIKKRGANNSKGPVCSVGSLQYFNEVSLLSNNSNTGNCNITVDVGTTKGGNTLSTQNNIESHQKGTSRSFPDASNTIKGNMNANYGNNVKGIGSKQNPYNNMNNSTQKGGKKNSGFGMPNNNINPQGNSNININNGNLINNSALDPNSFFLPTNQLESFGVSAENLEGSVMDRLYNNGEASANTDWLRMGNNGVVNNQGSYGAGVGVGQKGNDWGGR